MANQAPLINRQVVLVVDSTSYMEPYWTSLYKNCIYPALTYLDTRHKPDTILKTEYALVCFCDHAPYGDKTIKTNYFTNKLPLFDSWAKNVEFVGGGYAQNAVTEGLFAALELFPEKNSEGRSSEKYILLASNSRHHEIPCRLGGSDASDLPEIVKRISQMGAMLSCFLPHTLDPLKSTTKKIWEVRAACKTPNDVLKDLILPEVDHQVIVLVLGSQTVRVVKVYLRGIPLVTSKNGNLVHPATDKPATTPVGTTAIPATGISAQTINPPQVGTTPPTAQRIPQTLPTQAQPTVGQKREREDIPMAAKPGTTLPGQPPNKLARPGVPNIPSSSPVVPSHLPAGQAQASVASSSPGMPNPSQPATSQPVASQAAATAGGYRPGMTPAQQAAANRSQAVQQQQL
ncbi:hypothetical protein GUITHDRAFT_120768 [Guillardia theta CCMP2712]|uniref:Mediator of RNA polymerase II transcription subunit 25 n=1 Tax=Guillardia theta (strain CCMP2712) TaxID=905079 RepID=L1I9U9_GUITC|nr:hypothetical protein GUITHDRAFT_120768 [Guillardia theta CCMP2712]EKX33031.1 hypothetical protein GUITHDRAFT_120768 [Guillardia theta CCMP2712]|eukprot:XP_005820011.1 hypothetical protein GUITHDRAFT_120768 [Guillardia theta CCMP2712]